MYAPGLDFLCLGHKGSIAQCVKFPFFVQKLQFLEKLLEWSIMIFVSKLTIFSGKKFEIFEFFAPKLIKYCHFMDLFGQF